eukprot:TRINITY_DN2154_c0_g1_i1.p1 TRINITY_DN2154_c0_g1~~TRINITY_DN2154_c0_g1_i1.p1  ORF type:complete len:426 (-),score=93.63 TRINITY_DN2154_c0_g1_i1:69-1238(-)
MQRLFLLALFIASCFCLTPFYLSQNAINDSYIVVYPDSVEASIVQLHQQALLSMDSTHKISATWNRVINGFSAILTPTGLKYLMNLDEVSFIEQDQIMYASRTEQTCTAQNSATWGISRVSLRGAPQPTNTYRYSRNGDGVQAFVVDTGILITHAEFEGRAKWGTSLVTGESNTDLNGHGTHVAGTVAGVTYGIAKKATVIAVKVLGQNGSGSTTGIVSGLEWVSKNAKPNKDTCNMSLGGGASSALDNAVNNLAKSGIFTAVAAGNSNANACNYSPSRAADAFTVGSTSQGTGSTDPRSSFSNYGSCLNIFAPGEAITSAWIGSNTAIRTISGTSMASPHVCGVASLILGESSRTPAQVASQLIQEANPGTISGGGTGSPNVLLYSGC